MKDSSENGNTALSAETIQAWIILQLSHATGIEPSQIDTRLTFDSLGLDSLRAFILTGDLAEWLGRDLPATLLWDYPTIEALARRLAENWKGREPAVTFRDEMSHTFEEIEKLSEAEAHDALVKTRTKKGRNHLS